MKKLIVFIIVILFAFACKKESEVTTLPSIQLKTGSNLVFDGSSFAYGSAMKFNFTASGDGYPITYLRITRNLGITKVNEVDKGIYIKSGKMDTSFTFYRSQSNIEEWTLFIMNENRDSASITLLINKSQGAVWSGINHYTGIKMGYPTNSVYPKYLDLVTGTTWFDADVSGNEAHVDFATLYYLTSGTPSPTLTCPGYTGAMAYFPIFGNWTVKNQTTYDYKSTDNNTFSTAIFDSISNDSLLIMGYNPQYVSGWCKFAYTGKIVPFKTSSGKYGMLKIVNADQIDNGYMELEIKVQK